MNQAGQGQGAKGLAGQVIVGYRLERVLGLGATGAVYLGRRQDKLLQHAVVAVKVLMLPPQASAAERADFRERFEREAQMLSGLHHPHILAVQSYGEDPASGYAYMILPYLAGGTLAQKLGSALSLDDAARCASQIADALDYAHTHGVVHRDIKPANLLFDDHDTLFLADFGIARLFDAVGIGVTTTGRILGTAPRAGTGRTCGPCCRYL
jgi:serine/threonine protein kinase